MAQRKMTSAEVRAAYARGMRDFSDVNLDRVRLADTNLDRVRLDGATLDGAILVGASLDGASLDGASLDGASLDRASLDRAKLDRANLHGAILVGARLADANLNGARLDGARLDGAILAGALLTDANLADASLDGASLHGASLIGASLIGARLDGALLVGADLDRAILGMTVFANIDLSPLCDATGIKHIAPSRIDWSAVAKSYRHPRLKQFMIDCGVPPVFAEFMLDCARAEGEVSLRAMLQSTFISYGGPDEPFARKLYDSLRASGVVTFFFPESATLGERISDEVFRRIQEHDRVLLVCSRASLVRGKVVNEIQETLDREAKSGGATLLLPIMLDDYVLKGWKPARADLAERLVRRVIGDFRGADTDDTKFHAQLARVIDALKVKRVPSSINVADLAAAGGEE